MITADFSSAARDHRRRARHPRMITAGALATRA
jgi:hypothetical protein